MCWSGKVLVCNFGKEKSMAEMTIMLGSGEQGREPLDCKMQVTYLISMLCRT